MWALLFTTLALLDFTYGLSDGVYILKVHDSRRCKGAYLGVKYVGGPHPLRPHLVTTPSAATAPKWRVRNVGQQQYELQPVDTAIKLAYSSQCKSPSVLLRDTGYTKWKIASIRYSPRVFHIDAAQKMCPTKNGTAVPSKRLGPAAAAGTERCDEARVILSPVPSDNTSATSTWNFLKVVPRSPKPTRPPPPAPLVIVEIPKVAFVFAFPGLTVETFGPDQQDLFCSNLVQASNFPPEQVKCSVDSVRPSTGRRRRDLLQEEGGGGVTVDGSLTFTVTSAEDVASAQQAAEGFTELIEDPEELNTVLEDVSGGGVTVVSVSTEQVTTEVPETPPLSPDASPAPGNSPGLSPDTSSPGTSPDSSPGTSPSTEPSPSPSQPVPSPIPVPDSPSPVPESPSPEPEPEPSPSPRSPPPEPPMPEPEPPSPPLFEPPPPPQPAPPPESPPPEMPPPPPKSPPPSPPPFPPPPRPPPPSPPSPPPSPPPPSPPPPVASLITFTLDPCTEGTTDGYTLFTIDTQGSTLQGTPTATCTSTDGGTAGTVVVTENAGVYTASASGLDSGKTYFFAATVITTTSTTTVSSASFIVGSSTACASTAPTNPSIALVTNEPLQRTVSWEAPTNVGSGTINSYLITCTAASAESGTRTLVVDAPALTGVVGTGSPAGTNDPLLEGSVYTCSVAATKTYGTGPSAAAAPFGTELFVTSLGTKGWWSAGTAICSNFGESTCTGTTRQLRGIAATFPNNDYIGQGTTGYTSADDIVIAQYSIYFTDVYAGSTNGAVVVNGTNSNNGISDLHYYNTTSDGTPQSIVPVSFLLSSDFKASYRMYYGIGGFTPLLVRNPAFTHNVFNPTTGAKYGVIYSDPACLGSNACDKQWTTPNINSSSGFIIRKQTAPTGWVCLDGTLNNACNTVYNSLSTWAASVGGAPVFAPESFVWGVGSNMGTYQRNAFVAYDWLSTSVLNLGAKINFDLP